MRPLRGDGRIPAHESLGEALAAARAWWSRAAEQIDPADLWVLAPKDAIRTLASFIAQRQRPAAAAPPDDLDGRDTAFVELAVDLARGAGAHYFRAEIHGIEHVPASGPALLVGNHNGGIVTIDTLLTLLAVWDQHGPARAVHPLAHDILFHHPTLSRYARRLGVLRAGHGAGGAALRDGRLVLVYPGSDIDSFRPFGDRYRIELAGRTGFLRLALREGVPIIPVVSVGTHEQFIVLSRGDRLARLLGGKRLARIGVFPLVFALPFGVTSGFFPYWPLPAQTAVAFGPPLRWPALSPQDAEDPAILARCYAEVERHMQTQLDQLSAGRIPFIGRPDRRQT